MKIIDIKKLGTGETRTDGRYPSRIGCTVELEFEPSIGECMYLIYLKDNVGNDKSGILRTSLVQNIERNGQQLIVTTLNSIFILE